MSSERDRGSRRSARVPWAVVGAILFAGYVVHAAYAASSVCPVIGSCTSVHMAIMQGKPIPLPLQVASLERSVPVH